MKNKIFACLMWLTAMILLVNCQSQPAEVVTPAVVAQNTAAPTKTATALPTATATFTATPAATATSTATASATPTNTSTPKPTNTPRPTSTPTPTNTPLPPTVLDEYQLVLTFPDTLPLTVRKERNPGYYTNESEGYHWTNYPKYDLYQLTNSAKENIGFIEVYPLDEYKTINDGLTDLLVEMQNNVFAQNRVEDMSLLPLDSAATELFFIRQTYSPFKDGMGVGFLTLVVYGHAVVPVNAQNTFYYWVGFTADGKYLLVGRFGISFTLPTDENTVTLEEVRTAFLSCGMGLNQEVTLIAYSNEENCESFYNLWDQYLAQVETGLNNLPAEQFSPSLNDIDAIFQNMQLVAFDPNTPTPTAPTATPLPEFKAVVGSSYNANAAFYSCPKSDGPQPGGYINQGEQIEVVLGRSTTGNWLYVQHEGQIGWISVPLLTITGDVMLLPDVQATNGQCP